MCLVLSTLLRYFKKEVIWLLQNWKGDTSKPIGDKYPLGWHTGSVHLQKDFSDLWFSHSKLADISSKTTGQTTHTNKFSMCPNKLGITLSSIAVHGSQWKGCFWIRRYGSTGGNLKVVYNFFFIFGVLYPFEKQMKRCVPSPSIHTSIQNVTYDLKKLTETPRLRTHKLYNWQCCA